MEEAKQNIQKALECNENDFECHRMLSAVYLSKVIMLNSYSTNEKSGLSTEQIEWQEERSKRKIRKLDFEVR